MDGLGDVFVELPNKLTLGEKVLQMADLVLALLNPAGLGHQRAGAWDTLASLGSHRITE